MPGTIRTLMLALLAVVLFALAALAQDLDDRWREAAGKPVREIRFVGQHITSESYLREQIRTKIDDPCNKAAIDEDVKRLFATGRVSAPIYAYPEMVPGGVRIVFQVEELANVVDVVYEGLSAISEKDLNESIAGIRTKKPVEKDGFLHYVTYQEYRVRADERTIVDMERQKGKFFAECESEAVPVDGGVKVIFHVREGPTVRVKEIVFSGNDHIVEDDLLKVMKTRTPILYFVRSGYFNRDDLDEDVVRLRTYYRGEGYLDAQVFIEDLRFNGEHDRVTVAIRVLEGDRYSVRRLEVRNTSVFTADAVKAKLASKPGDPFSGKKFDEDRRAIEKMYQDKGYVFAKARAQPVLAGEGRQVDLIFNVEEGEPISVEKVVIRGNVKTKDEVVRRDLDVMPGEAFNAQAMDDSRQRLGRRGYYKDLHVSFDPGTTKDARDAVVQVEEADTGNIVFGGGISTSTGPFGQIVFSQRNFDITDVPTSVDDVLNGRFFVGAGQTFVINAQPGLDQSRYSITFVEPFLLPDYIPFPLQFRETIAYADSTIFDTYTKQTLETETGFGYRITRDMLLELFYRFTDTGILDVTSDAPADEVAVAGQNYVSTIGLGYQIDQNQIDQNFVAYGGWGASATVETAGGPLAYDYDFFRAEIDGNYQLTLFDWPRSSHHVLAARGRVGWMEPYGRDTTTPFFERYIAGGIHSVRGFRFGAVGPAPDQNPIGGNALVTASLEYSFPIIPGFDETVAPQWRGDFLRGAFFCDVGNVEPDWGHFYMDDFRVSVGFGVRVKLPIFPAPVQLDFGFPVRKQPGDATEIFSFSIGTGLP